jgi:hypothetical protein
MKDTKIVEKGGYQDSWKRKASWSHLQLFLLCVDDREPCRVDLVTFTTQSPLSDNFIECSSWRRTLSSFTLMLTVFIGVRLRGRTRFGMSGEGIFLDRLNRMGTQSRV